MSADLHTSAAAGGVVVAPTTVPRAAQVSSVGTRRYTREDVLNLGKAGRPWEFVPVALAALKVAPGDAAVRFLLAAAYARLGLRTAAGEQLDLLPGPARADAGVRALAESLLHLPPDDMDPAERAAICRSNLEALAARTTGPGGVDLRGELDEWRTRAARAQWFRASDGNIVTRVRGQAGVTAPWTRFRDDRAEAQATTFPQAGPEGAAGPPWIPPCILEGVDPPWMLQRVWELMPPGDDGYTAPLTLMQADVHEFLDGLACADLRPLLRDERLRVIVGPGAVSNLAADLSRRIDTQILGPVVSLATTRARVTPSVQEILEAAAREQRREQDRLDHQVRAIYAGRDRRWWAARYADTATEPLRILIPTCRFSTFIRHSATDLARAFEAAGLQARVVMEPDAHSHLSSLAYSRIMAEYRPDLIVLINYTRASLGGAVPPEVPFVCWVQDAMPHQFDESAGARQGELDFLVGHLHTELFTRFRYPRERALTFPVAASADKFHTAPVDPNLRRRFECDLAMVTNHSETPEAMHERLLREAGSAPGRRILEALRPRIWQVALESDDQPVRCRLEAAARQALRHELGEEPAARTLALVHRSCCMALADRVVRHETLEWAAAIAKRRGWRLHLYGRGWELHPRLSAFARGELEHGEQLRAAYASAGAHLHASIHTLVHQRVMECALSGGLPLCRRHHEALAIPTWRAQRAAAMGRHPLFCDLTTRRTGYAVADCPEGMRLAALAQRLGLPADWALWIGPHERLTLMNYEEFLKPEYDPSWLLVDMAATTFAGPEELEGCVERSLERPAWRRELSSAVASRVRERLTHRALADRVIERITRSLSPGATSGMEPSGLPARTDRLRSTLRAQHDSFRRTGLTTDERWADRVAAAYAPPAWARGAITPEDAFFLYSMVRCVRPRRAIEIGVGSGASTALLLAALADTGATVGDAVPALHSFDLHPWCYFDRSRAVGSAVAEMVPDLARMLSLHVRKTAIDAAAMFASDPVDLAFIDGDHRHPWPTADLLALLPALRPGAWVVLHDIDLPEYARRHEVEHQTIVDWHQVGAALLFDAWPFQKLRGEGGAFNIGAVRVPERGGVSARDFARILTVPWEVEVDDRTRPVLGGAGPPGPPASSGPREPSDGDGL